MNGYISLYEQFRPTVDAMIEEVSVEISRFANQTFGANWLWNNAPQFQNSITVQKLPVKM